MALSEKEFSERLQKYRDASYTVTSLLRLVHSHAERFRSMGVTCKEDRKLAVALGEIGIMLEEVILPRMDNLSQNLDVLELEIAHSKEEELQAAGKQI